MKTLGLLISLLFTNAQADVQISKLKVPAGFKVTAFVTNIGNARSMTWGTKGNLFVGTRDVGKVYAVTPEKKIITIARGLNMPNGVAFRDGALFVAEVRRILKYPNIEANLQKPPKPIVIYEDFPSDRHHGWKFIAFGPDGKLYVPVGAPCNICESKDPYASITRIDPDGKNLEIVARGVRNTVGFDWHPQTKQLWFTDNGRDMMGDDLPADELNHVATIGAHYGYPYCHQGDTLDPEFGKGKKCSDYVAPDLNLGAHVAALGMRFYTGKMFPPEYRNQIFIAQQGSWNRSRKSGYNILLVTLDKNGKVAGSRSFMDGWMADEKHWGQPIDVIQTATGSLLVSDSYANAIYEITYSKRGS